MQTLFNLFVIVNIIGCIIGMFLMLKAFLKEDIEKTQPEWNAQALLCFVSCFFGILREIYSVVHGSQEMVAAWPFKTTTAGIFLITISFYRLSVKAKRIYVKERDNK